MNGGVRKRGSTWSYYFDLGKVNGKRKKKEKGGFKTKKDAEAALAKALNEYNNSGDVFEPVGIIVSDYLDFWMENYCMVNCKTNTIFSYKNAIEKHIKPQLGLYRLKALSPALIQKWLNGLKADGYSKSSITLFRDTLSASLNYAVYPLQYIQTNPCLMVKLPKMEKDKEEKRFVISPEDFHRIIECFNASTPYYIPLMIGYYTGMRINEIYGLSWDDIDLENRTIQVKRTMIRGKAPVKRESPWYLNPPKSETSERVIKFGATLYQALKEARHKKMKNRIRYGQNFVEVFTEDTDNASLKHLVYRRHSETCALSAIDLVCVNENGSYSGCDNLRILCRKVINDEMGIKFNFHSLRHTHATMLIQNGASIKSVQERLGHANVAVTMGIYAHNTEEQQEETVKIFEQCAKQI